MNMNSYKFGYSGPESTSYYGSYEVNDHLPRMDVSRRAWEYPSMVTEESLPTTNSQPEGDENADADAEAEVHATPEECNSKHFFSFLSCLMLLLVVTALDRLCLEMI